MFLLSNVVRSKHFGLIKLKTVLTIFAARQCIFFIYPFHAGHFLYPLKTSEKLCFFMFSESIERDRGGMTLVNGFPFVSKAIFKFNYLLHHFY